MVSLERKVLWAMNSFVCDGLRDLQMMLFFSFAVVWLQFYWTKLLATAFGIYFMV